MLLRLKRVAGRCMTTAEPKVQGPSLAGGTLINESIHGKSRSSSNQPAEERCNSKVNECRWR